jgi:hypothetical protein
MGKQPGKKTAALNGIRDGLSSTRRAEKRLKYVSPVPGKITARKRPAARLNHKPLGENIPVYDGEPLFF